jgi:hypothetical protein
LKDYFTPILVPGFLVRIYTNFASRHGGQVHEIVGTTPLKWSVAAYKVTVIFIASEDLLSRVAYQAGEFGEIDNKWCDSGKSMGQSSRVIRNQEEHSAVASSNERSIYVMLICVYFVFVDYHYHQSNYGYRLEIRIKLYFL